MATARRSAASAKRTAAASASRQLAAARSTPAPSALRLHPDVPPIALGPLLEAAQAQLKRARIAPQPGPQTLFVESEADICIYGGAAFAGKTFGLLLQPTKFINNALFSAVIFRRDTTQIRNPGGLWDESLGLYKLFDAAPVEQPLEHTFPSGSRVKFAHLQHEKDKYSWDGAQIPFIGFDQLEHFTRTQFFYMLSRNRSASGVRPHIRATCNPDADSWLAEFLEWWIDQETGYAIPARAGKVRWMYRGGDDTIEWADTREELVKKHRVKGLPLDHPEQPLPKSVQFIPGRITDNKIGMAKDPTYLGNLKAMQRVERERLLQGNWKIRPGAGLMFNRLWCPVVETAPADTVWVRYWDLAATEKTENNDPDWTVGLKLGYSYKEKKYVIGRVRRLRDSAGMVRRAMRVEAESDGDHCRVGFPQDPGQAGKDQAQQLVAHMTGYNATYRIESGDKVVRFSPFSAQCEAGNVLRLRDLGPDGEDFLRNLEAFPDGEKKDDADACSGAFAMFQEGRSMGVFEYYRELYEKEQARLKALSSNGHAGAAVEVPPPSSAEVTALPGANVMAFYGRKI